MKYSSSRGPRTRMARRLDAQLRGLKMRAIRLRKPGFGGAWSLGFAGDAAVAVGAVATVEACSRRGLRSDLCSGVAPFECAGRSVPFVFSTLAPSACSGRLRPRPPRRRRFRGASSAAGVAGFALAAAIAGCPSAGVAGVAAGADFAAAGARVAGLRAVPVDVRGRPALSPRARGAPRAPVVFGGAPAVLRASSAASSSLSVACAAPARRGGITSRSGVIEAVGIFCSMYASMSGSPIA